MRLFTALVPPADAIEHLDDFLDSRRAAAGFRWTPADQLHVTLAFMADVRERSLDDLCERLERAAERRTAVRARLAGGGAFPHADAGRVLWAGLDLDEDGRAEVGRLAAAARAAASTAGAGVDGATFRPHVTVARSGAPVGLTSWVRLLDAYAGPEWSTDTMVLVASHLGEGPRRRPRHEVLESWTIRPR